MIKEQNLNSKLQWSINRAKLSYGMETAEFELRRQVTGQQSRSSKSHISHDSLVTLNSFARWRSTSR
jgi:hypothetical protein